VLPTESTSVAAPLPSVHPPVAVSVLAKVMASTSVQPLPTLMVAAKAAAHCPMPTAVSYRRAIASTFSSSSVLPGGAALLIFRKTVRRQAVARALDLKAAAEIFGLSAAAAICFHQADRHYQVLYSCRKSALGICIQPIAKREQLEAGHVQELRACAH